ncbi:hypothetical protein MLD38_017163 [Melastoma candidum]|uniref:Uncharacterized protein n=1 Tax=Melastoma candidum TaxID=119954 RepID=A0ACB9QPX6_9MYRT|nr:hypothetical protein MLD38_017163 [Melastoma candidum]
MASVTMAASSLLATSVSVAKQPARGALVINAKASSSSSSSSTPQKASLELKARDEERSGRRDLVFASVAAAACMVAKVALADDEPKPGTPEAKKKYAPICVTMPTAKICHK